MVDQEQFRKYEELGAYHWKYTYDGGWLRSSPGSHARYDLALDWLARRLDLESARGLDVGCGDGVMLYKVAQRGGVAIGVDLEHAGLKAGRAALVARGVPARMVCGSTYHLPFADDTFDYVCAIEVLEHLPDPEQWLAEIRRVLAPTGSLALTTPNRRESGELRDPYHTHEYDRQELDQLLRVYFKDVTVRGQYPLRLVRLYQKGVGLRPVDLGIRFGFKVLTRLGWNPFTSQTTDRPDYSWEGLAAIASNPIPGPPVGGR